MRKTKYLSKQVSTCIHFTQDSHPIPRILLGLTILKAILVGAHFYDKVCNEFRSSNAYSRDLSRSFNLKRKMTLQQSGRIT